MSGLLEGLCEDHANFGKVLNVIESQAEAIYDGATADIDIIVKAVTYFSGYPTLFHHPAENAICERLKNARPAVKATVDGIVAEHGDVARLLADFRRKVEEVLAGRRRPDEDFARAAISFIDAQWRHMERERSELFPAVEAVLSQDDWKVLEERLILDRDIHLRDAVPAELERLHELMSACRSFDDRRIQRRALAAAQSTR